MTDAAAKLAAKTATLADVAPLQIYGWLLVDEEKAKAEKMVKTIAASATTMVECMKGALRAAPRPRPSRSRRTLRCKKRSTCSTEACRSGARRLQLLRVLLLLLPTP
jgi:hypothetical protein